MTRRSSVQMLTATTTTLIQALAKKEEMGFGIHSKKVWCFIDHTHMVDFRKYGRDTPVTALTRIFRTFNIRWMQSSKGDDKSSCINFEAKQQYKEGKAGLKSARLDFTD